MDFDLISRFLFGGEYEVNKPTFGEVILGNIILVALVVIIFLAIEAGKYAVGEKIFGKGKGWKAIIPFYGFFMLFRAIGLNPFLSIIIAVPIVGLVPLGIFSFFLPKAFGAKSEYCIFAIFLPFVIYNMLGFDKKYEYQYVKGKNVAFKNEFRTIMPEDLSTDASTPASAVNGAAVSPMAAKQSEISLAASAAAEQTRLIVEEKERREKEEAEKKAAEEAKKKESKNSEEFNYDIFNNEKENTGPESSDIDPSSFKLVNGRFSSVSAPTPALKSTPAPKAPTLSPAKPAVPIPPKTVAPKPVQPALETPKPAQATPATPKTSDTPKTPEASKPVEPSAPVKTPPIAPSPATTPAPGISIAPVPPKQ